jgi:hypothetical protein
VCRHTDRLFAGRDLVGPEHLVLHYWCLPVQVSGHPCNTSGVCH